MNSTRNFSNLHQSASALNGNNGEWTNSDDVAMNGFLCRRERDVDCARHYHRKPKKASTGAARRIQEKVKLCKPVVTVDELELCTVGVECIMMSDTPHYHIHTHVGGRAMKGDSNVVLQSVKDEEEKAAGLADALAEIEEDKDEVGLPIAPTLPEIVEEIATEVDPVHPPGLSPRVLKEEEVDHEESEGDIIETKVDDMVNEPIITVDKPAEVAGVVSEADDEVREPVIAEKPAVVAVVESSEMKPVVIVEDTGAVEAELARTDELNVVPVIAECKDIRANEVGEVLSEPPLDRECTYPRVDEASMTPLPDIEDDDDASIPTVSTDHFERVNQIRHEEFENAGGQDCDRGYESGDSSNSSSDSSEYSAWQDFDSDGGEVPKEPPPPPEPDPAPDPWMEDVIEVTIYSMFDAEDARHPLVKFFREVYDALLGAERNVVSASRFERTLTHGTAYQPSIFNLYYGSIEQETFRGTFDPSRGYLSEYRAKIKERYVEFLMETSTSSGLTVGGMTAEWLPRQLLTTLQREFPDALRGSERIQITVDTINYVMVNTVLISAGLCNSNGYSLVNKSKLVAGLQKLENRP